MAATQAKRLNLARIKLILGKKRWWGFSKKFDVAGVNDFNILLTLPFLSSGLLEAFIKEYHENQGVNTLNTILKIYDNKTSPIW